MALDLNAPPDEEGDEGPDLNHPPTNEDRSIHDSLEAFDAGQINRGEDNSQVQITAGHTIDLNVPQAKGSLHLAQNAARSFDFNDHEHQGEEANLLPGENAGHPFSSHDPHEEENLHADAQDVMDDLIEDLGVYADDLNVIFGEEDFLDSDDEEYQPTEQDEASNRIKHLTARQRLDIYEDLLQYSINGKLKRKTTTHIAAKYNVHVRTIQRIWQRAKQCRAQGIPVDVGSLKAKNCGRKKISVDLSSVPDIPLNRRGTIRSLASALGVNKSSLHRLFQEGLLRRHSNSLKPYLKEENKKDRLRWCLSMLDQSTLSSNPKFNEMENIIHTDEKWFNGTRKTKTMYMTPDEEDPHRTVQNKNSIHKVMFYSGVARPRFDDEGRCYFDGKLGMWPFVRSEPAQRRSGNRPRGTPITKSMKVDRKTMRSYMITKLLPAIRDHWPREDAHKIIWIQQDNAPSHVLVDDVEFAAAVANTGFDVRLRNQPANSPDMNCLDLGFFNSLQSLTDRMTSRNMDELIQNVDQEYRNYDPILLNRVFLTLQQCMIEVMKDDGGNKYKIPHMNKEGLEAEGMLPRVLSVDSQLVQRAVDKLGN